MRAEKARVGVPTAEGAVDEAVLHGLRRRPVHEGDHLGIEHRARTGDGVLVLGEGILDEAVVRLRGGVAGCALRGHPRQASTRRKGNAAGDRLGGDGEGRTGMKASARRGIGGFPPRGAHPIPGIRTSPHARSKLPACPPPPGAGSPPRRPPRRASSAAPAISRRWRACSARGARPRDRVGAGRDGQDAPRAQIATRVGRRALADEARSASARSEGGARSRGVLRGRRPRAQRGRGGGGAGRARPRRSGWGARWRAGGRSSSCSTTWSR